MKYLRKIIDFLQKNDINILSNKKIIVNGEKFMENKINRFLGFANVYDEGRPKLPKQAIEILKTYLDNNIETIIDIGCGTGLSTEVCTNYANTVIGIDPSIDMLNQAKLKENSKLQFKQAFADNTGLENNIADIVICSQAFHWMEPKSTIQEVFRILKKGGIFAIIDAEYPPVINKDLEKLNLYLREKTANLENHEKTWITTKKSEHLKYLKDSNLFDYTREICFSNIEKYDKERFKKFLLSQSSMQQAIKNNYTAIENELIKLDKTLDSIFNGNTLNALYSYKMKIAIK